MGGPPLPNKPVMNINYNANYNSSNVQQTSVPVLPPPKPVDPMLQFTGFQSANSQNNYNNMNMNNNNNNVNMNNNGNYMNNNMNNNGNYISNNMNNNPMGWPASNQQQMQQMQRSPTQNMTVDNDPFAIFLTGAQPNASNPNSSFPTLQPPPPARARARSRNNNDPKDLDNLFF